MKGPPREMNRLFVRRKEEHIASIVEIRSSIMNRIFLATKSLFSEGGAAKSEAANQRREPRVQLK